MGAFYLISGNEDYAVKERANEMMRALCGDPPDDNPSLEIIRGDSDNEKACLLYRSSTSSCCRWIPRRSSPARRSSG